MHRILQTGAFRLSCSTSAATPTKRNLLEGIRKNRERGNRQQQARTRNLKQRVRKTTSKKEEAGRGGQPGRLLRDAYVTSRCLSGSVNRATTRRTADDWEDTAVWAPRELELSGQPHTQMCLPDLPTAVTP